MSRPGTTHEAGPLVRSFALTGGRARTGSSVDLLAFVVATDTARGIVWRTQPEHRAILAHAATPIRWPNSRPM